MKLHAVLSMVLVGLLMAGRFYCGDGMGCNVMLTPHEGSVFENDWLGSDAWAIIYDDTRGTWALKDWWEPILVRPEGRGFYEEVGIDRASCFRIVTDH